MKIGADIFGPEAPAPRIRWRRTTSGTRARPGRRRRAHNLTKLLHRLDILQAKLAPVEEETKDSAEPPSAAKLDRWLKKSARIRRRIKDVVDDFHWKAIHLLLQTARQIIIPRFGVAQMVQRSGVCESCVQLGVDDCEHARQRRTIAKLTVRRMLLLRHMEFLRRLRQKALEYQDARVLVGTEEYTTKQCEVCGCLNESVGSQTVFACPKCGHRADRDVHAALNEGLKYVSHVSPGIASFI